MGESTRLSVGNEIYEQIEGNSEKDLIFSWFLEGELDQVEGNSKDFSIFSSVDCWWTSMWPLRKMKQERNIDV